MTSWPSCLSAVFRSNSCGTPEGFVEGYVGAEVLGDAGGQALLEAWVHAQVDICPQVDASAEAFDFFCLVEFAQHVEQCFGSVGEVMNSFAGELRIREGEEVGADAVTEIVGYERVWYRCVAVWEGCCTGDGVAQSRATGRSIISTSFWDYFLFYIIWVS